ncbi:MAG: DUF736 family protein [Alphaproteobacteria bacterium]
MKNMKLGKFIQDSQGQLHGKINGLGMGSISVIGKPTTSSAGKAYLKLIADPMIEAYEVGAAFPKEKNGINYYIVTLDSPLFQSGVTAALFPDKEREAIFNLVWSRSEPSGLSPDAALEAQQARRYTAAAPVAAL